MRWAALAAFVVFGTPAHAFDSLACEPGTSVDCEGLAAARIPWLRSEHALAWLKTRELAGLPAAIDEPFSVRTLLGGTSIEGQPSFEAVPLDAVMDTVTRQVEIAVFAQLPDFSYALWDWVSGHESCPPAGTAGFAACHAFKGHMGWLNSNHFLPQAEQAFFHFHDLALARAGECRQTGSLVAGASRSDDGLLNACDREALVLEAIAHHYLQDAWSMGHMWQRWGSPNLADFSAALTSNPSLGNLKAIGDAVGIGAGIIHGAKAITGVDDAMCAPDDGVEYVDNRGRHPGAGDLFFEQVDADARLADQRAMLFACTTSAMREVYLASAQSFGQAQPSQTQTTALSSCFGQRATNRAMGLGAAIQIPKVILDSDDGTVSPGRAISDAYLRVLGLNPQTRQYDYIPLTSEIASYLLHRVGALHDTVMTQWNEDMGRIQRTLTGTVVSPFDTDLADGALGQLLGMWPNGSYDAWSTPYADPPLPWIPTKLEGPTAATIDQAGNYVARTFSLAHTADWCGVMTAAGTGEFSLEVLKNRCQDGTLDAAVQAVACSLCRERAAPHLREVDATGAVVKEALCVVLDPSAEVIDVPAGTDVASKWCSERIALHLKFDEGSGAVAADSSGHGHHGTLGGGATWTTGSCPAAVDLRAPGSTVIIPNHPTVDLASAAWTLSFWFWSDAVPGEMLAKHDRAYDVGWQVRRWCDLSLSCTVDFFCDDCRTMTALFAPFQSGEWQHIAVTHSNGNYSLYVNGGTPVQATGGFVLPDTADLVLGPSATPGEQGALLDDLRIYDSALPETDVAALAAWPCPGP